jgi:ABC-2 type transport system ATP-binding protein
MNNAIEVSRLTKVYQIGKDKSGLRAVDGINFAVREGEVFGFLGPNGAGKTTTIRMLTGLTRPTSGQGQVMGLDLARDMARIKKRVGVVPETSNLYDELSAFDNLVFAMQLYGVPRAERKARAEELLHRFRLGEKREAPFARLSRGMKRALTIAAALAHRPPLLFLDEPTTGLDVMSARNLRQMIAGLRDEGVTVFLTTHYLEEAERLCDRVAVIVKGRIVALDSVDGLKGRMQGRTAVEVTLGDAGDGVETLRFEGDDVPETVQAALTRAETSGRRVLAVNTLRPTLEDVFVQLTGLSAEVMLAEKGARRQGNAGG